MKEHFIDSVQNKKKVKLTFFSKQDNCNLTRMCAPMDFAPSSRAKDKSDRFHLWDYESNEGNHVLSLLPAQIVDMEFTNIDFNPSDFVSWEPKWVIVRDWGEFS